MSPQQRQINELKAQVQTLRMEMDSLKSAATIDPQIPRAISIRNAVITRGAVGDTSGLLKLVDEEGTSSYNVADAPNGSLILIDANGVEYKVATYTI